MEIIVTKQMLMDMPKVNHDYLYHAEIMYETKDGFDYKSAVGNTLKELLKDIDIRLKQLAKRNPKLIQALYKPKEESVNITPKILTLMRFKPYYSSK